MPAPDFLKNRQCTNTIGLGYKAAMKPLITALAFLFLGSVFCPWVAAAPFPARGKFVYSDLCAGPEPWRVQGHRVELLHGPEGDFVSVEFSDKGFDSDVLHSPRVELSPADGSLWFAYVDFSDEYAFEGDATPQELTGTFDDDLEVHTLPRVPNSWPEQPPCPTPEWDPSPEFPE
jgi:hypothetical protein